MTEIEGQVELKCKTKECKDIAPLVDGLLISVTDGSSKVIFIECITCHEMYRENKVQYKIVKQAEDE